MITNEQSRRVFCLEISGLQTRFYSHVEPSNLSNTITTNIDYINTRSINSVSDYQAQLDPAGGIASYSPLTISLTFNRFDQSFDASTIFSRVGGRSKGVLFAQLQTTITHTQQTPFTIDIDQDFTSLNYPCLMHIGSETFRVLSATSSSLTIDQRGVSKSPIQSHITTLDGTKNPFVCTEITTFRGRRAVLYVAHLYQDQSHSDFTPLINGFIESTPYLEDGLNVNLSIVPLVALIDGTEYSKRGLETGLLHNYHYYGIGFGNKLQYFLQNTKTFTLNFASIDTINHVITLSFPSNLDLFFDLTLQDGTIQGESVHPRFPLIQGVFTGAKIYPTALNGTSGNITSINYDNTKSDLGIIPTAGLTGSLSTHYILGGSELKTLLLGVDQLKKWPNVINDTLESVQNENTTQGFEGQWARYRLSNGGQSITVSKNAQSSNYPVNLGFSINYPDELDQETERGVFRVDLLKHTFIDQRASPLKRRLLWYGLNVKRAGFEGRIRESDYETVTLIKYNTNNGSNHNSIDYEIQGASLAYYQRYESRILVKESLGLSGVPSDSTALDIEYYDFFSDSLKTQIINATHETIATFNGVQVGYYIHIETDLEHLQKIKSFGDWRDKEATKIRKTSSILEEPAGIVLLKLLMSGGGGFVNGLYDVLPIGLNIHQNDIDIDSFIQYSLLSGLPDYSIDLNSQDVKFRELIEPILKSMSCALIMKRSESGSKIALQPIGLDQTTNIQGTIEAGEFLANTPPFWSNSDDIVTQVICRYNYDDDQDKYMSRVVINNQEAITRYNDERSKVEFDFRGLSSDLIGGGANQFQFFLPFAQRIFNLLSDPLRLWYGSISTAKGIYVDIGSYWQVSSPHLKGFGDSWGVTNKAGMVTSINQSFMNCSTDLELVTTGLNVVNWNSSIKVQSISSLNSVIVSINTYSTNDLQYFKAGDVVDYLNYLDQDSFISGLTIQSINDSINEITFNQNHGIINASGNLEPTTFLNASSDHQKDAFLSDSTGLLGNNNESQKYS